MSEMLRATSHQDEPTEVTEFEQTPCAMFLVLSLDMALTHASEGGERWLTDFRRGLLEDFLSQASASALALGVEGVLDSYDVRAMLLCVATRPHKRHGCYLVTVETLHCRPCLASLTPREFQVAEYAIYGATNPEIASGLGIGLGRSDGAWGL